MSRDLDRAGASQGSELRRRSSEYAPHTVCVCALAFAVAHKVAGSFSLLCYVSIVVLNVLQGSADVCELCCCVAGEL